ncbi:hypothetical protein SCLCIDRAFT_1220397 [Scleroderma citrinum Foug A]|uniref:Uncharacterized protein n=1 Tax=Scleroderma citrinum Foug A TaxID=1036808 RepID=A0A0C2ZV26_9AGAM|nr:hypothetical protein SCLCIDRAFT_1220397 [Scleroderma citrinum Foug A]
MTDVRRPCRGGFLVTTLSYLSSQLVSFGSPFGVSQFRRIMPSPVSDLWSLTLPVPPSIQTLFADHANLPRYRSVRKKRSQQFTDEISEYRGSSYVHGPCLVRELLCL